MALPLRLSKPLASTAASLPHYYSHTSSLAVTVAPPSSPKPQILVQAAPKMSTATEPHSNTNPTKVIDSHLHVWASPQEAADKYPYFPTQEPTSPGHVDFLLQSMEEAGVDGALIVQPINHKFDHSYVTRKSINVIQRKYQLATVTGRHDGSTYYLYIMSLNGARNPGPAGR